MKSINRCFKINNDCRTIDSCKNVTQKLNGDMKSVTKSNANESMMHYED